MPKLSYRRMYYTLKSEINMIPLLDVILVLLLIFMSITPFIKNQSINIKLSDINNLKNINIKDNYHVVIEISDTKQYCITVNSNRIDHLSLNQIITQAQSQLKINPKTIFFIAGKKNVSYNEIMDLINALNVIGVRPIGLITHHT